MKKLFAELKKLNKKVEMFFSSPSMMAEYFCYHYNGTKEIIKLCIKHYLVLLAPLLSIQAGVCWFGWKLFLAIDRVEVWFASLFQAKKNGITWE